MEGDGRREMATIEELELHVSPAEKKEAAGDFILTPSSPGDRPETMDLTLEADSFVELEEITFDGETESESRIEEAMKAYDAAMDAAAGME